MQLPTLLTGCAVLAAAISAQTPPATTPPATTPPATTPPAIKPTDPPPFAWKDLTRSGIPIRFYGFFRLDAYYNTARMDSVVVPFRVLQETTRNDDQFDLDPRLTQLGVDVLPGEVGGSMVGGKLEIDFANFPTGTTESRATPRMRLAYVDIAQGDYGLRIGQDWDVIAPLKPAVNGETLMWNAGNLGDRRPQIQGRLTPADTTFELKAALGLTGAITNQDLDVPTGERDGFDSGMPHLQLRAAGKPWGIVDDKPVELGAWGLFGRIETDTAFNGEKRFDTWTAGLDVQVPLTSSLTVRGEVWTGENLGDVRGGVGQTINTTLGREIGSTGGFGEFVYAHTAKTRFHAGGTVDDPQNEDLSAGNPSRNLAGYAGTVVDWDSGLRTGLDVIYWETEYVGGAGNTVRFDLYFQYNF